MLSRLEEQTQQTSEISVFLVTIRLLVFVMQEIIFAGNRRTCSGAPCPTDYPLRSVSGRFGSAVVSRDCRSVQALSHLLDARQRARVFETLPTKTELRLWL